MSKLPEFSMRDLLDAGVHFGHRKNAWNPKMAKYVYGVRNGIHIIDLGQTVEFLKKALAAVKDVASKNGRVLFVGTKKQASEVLATEATRCGQYFVNHRWLGGMLTNWSTISASIKTLQKYEELLANEEIHMTKKERLDLERKRSNLHNVLGGIRNMGGKPDILFVIDTNQEKLAITEAKKLNIPVIAIVDSNSNPEGVDYPIPGNDDARKAIELYGRLLSDAVLSGLQDGLTNAGVDIGAIDMGSMFDAANTEIDLEAAGEKSEAPKSKGKKKPEVAVVTKKKAPKKAEAKEEAAAE